MFRRNSSNPALKTATCAALMAASLAVPVNSQAVTSIERYCTTSWRQAGIPMHDWEDCTQDTLLELLSRLQPKQIEDAIQRPMSSERRELMRSIWCVSQRWRRGSKRQPVSLDSLPECDCRSETARDMPWDTEAVATAMDVLNANQRRILQLWSDGNTVAEIAAELDLPAARVSDLKYKAIRKLRAEIAEIGQTA